MVPSRDEADPRYAQRERQLSDYCRQEAARTTHASGLGEKPDCMVAPWNCPLKKSLAQLP